MHLIPATLALRIGIPLALYAHKPDRRGCDPSPSGHRRPIGETAEWREAWIGRARPSNEVIIGVQ
jgi:hypothetical protein